MSDNEAARAAAAAAPDGVGVHTAAGPSPMTGFGSRLLAFVLAPILFPQSRVVLANLPILPEADHDWEGTIDGPDPLRLLVLGDSTGAGVGVESLREGLAGNLAEWLAPESPGSAANFRDFSPTTSLRHKSDPAGATDFPTPNTSSTWRAFSPSEINE